MHSCQHLQFRHLTQATHRQLEFARTLVPKTWTRKDPAVTSSNSKLRAFKSFAMAGFSAALPALWCPAPGISSSSVPSAFFSSSSSRSVVAAWYNKKALNVSVNSIASSSEVRGKHKLPSMLQQTQTATCLSFGDAQAVQVEVMVTLSPVPVLNDCLGCRLRCLAHLLTFRLRLRHGFVAG